MAGNETIDQVNDAAQDAQEGINSIAKTDPAKTDVLGKRKGKGKGGDDDEDSSLRIHIKLDLDVEVHLTARVKGDITIGLL